MSRLQLADGPSASSPTNMTSSYSGYRFPAHVIHRAIWVYLRFTLSYRDVEDLLAERGIDVSYETIRRWVTTFGPRIARRLRARRPVPHRRWHLDEMFVRIAGKQMHLWRAVDAECEVLEVLVQANRHRRAAAMLMCKLHKRRGIGPTEWVTASLPPSITPRSRPTPRAGAGYAETRVIVATPPA